MSGAPLNWGAIPAELRERPQWVVAGSDRSPLTLNGDGKLVGASVTVPECWLTFERATEIASSVGLGVGYVLHKDDPYTCIDIDVKDADNEPDPRKHTDPEVLRYQWERIKTFNTYTELSTGGKGLHVWLRGKIGEGRRRGNVEVYSQERYIICTGNPVIECPIIEDQGWLGQITSEMEASGKASDFVLVEYEEEYDDREIIDIASRAENGDKFNDLCAGEWLKYGYPSQSEADLSLMSMLAFYSQSNEQCRRLFRMTALGKREKAIKNNRYVDYTLRIIRKRQADDANDIEDGRQKARALLEVERLNAQFEAASKQDHSFHEGEEAVIVDDGGLEWPPGNAGDIAGYIYRSAPRPVKEVAIVATLGLLAGLCGKAFSIPQSGLNIYVILVGRSGIGKETLHSGISSICNAVSVITPTIMNFVSFNDFASGPALVKEVAAKQSMVNVAGEWGKKLKRMSRDDGRDNGVSTLRTKMTDLYQKSGPQAIVGGITYSNKDNNIESVSGVAYSMIGETTPSTFYESLTEDMMEDGFLSRFTIVEYEGDRPPLNTAQELRPPQYMVDAIATLATYADHLICQQQTVSVSSTPEAAVLMGQFDRECDANIIKNKQESRRQMWNRASLKVMRISGLLAVIDNWTMPCITVDHVQWALKLVRRDIGVMEARLDSGDVGMGDDTRGTKVLAVCREYIKKGVAKSYNIPEAMVASGIIPRSFLQTRTARITAFSKHKGGSTMALDLTVKSLIDSGYLLEMRRSDMVAQYGFHGKCYQVLGFK